jgi:NADPH:quinone reductase-like Zn-dependent oxidoreductase
MLFELGGLEAGRRVLINGAGGAVGGAAVQLAKRAGATVIATAGPRSTATVRAFGADEIVDHTVTAVAAAVTEPVDLVVNLVSTGPDEINKLKLATLAAAVDKGELKLEIFARRPLSEIAQVQTEGQAGRFHGKVLLVIEN